MIRWLPRFLYWFTVGRFGRFRNPCNPSMATEEGSQEGTDSRRWLPLLFWLVRQLEAFLRLFGSGN
jgi:hypothetical protein